MSFGRSRDPALDLVYQMGLFMDLAGTRPRPDCVKRARPHASCPVCPANQSLPSAQGQQSVLLRSSPQQLPTCQFPGSLGQHPNCSESIAGPPVLATARTRELSGCEKPSVTGGLPVYCSILHSCRWGGRLSMGILLPHKPSIVKENHQIMWPVSFSLSSLCSCPLATC